jgi:hypothetical protein
MPVFCLGCGNNFTYGKSIMKKENSTYDRLIENNEFKKEFEKESKNLDRSEKNQMTNIINKKYLKKLKILNENENDIFDISIDLKDSIAQELGLVN